MLMAEDTAHCSEFPRLAVCCVVEQIQPGKGLNCCSFDNDLMLLSKIVKMFGVTLCGVQKLMA